MSKQPPSSGRFGHPALDKILQTLAKAQADATKTRNSVQPAPAPTQDDILYEVLAHQRLAFMQQHGIGLK